MLYCNIFDENKKKVRLIINFIMLVNKFQFLIVSRTRELILNLRKSHRVQYCSGLERLVKVFKFPFKKNASACQTQSVRSVRFYTLTFLCGATTPMCLLSLLSLLQFFPMVIGIINKALIIDIFVFSLHVYCTRQRHSVLRSRYRHCYCTVGDRNGYYKSCFNWSR